MTGQAPAEIRKRAAITGLRCSLALDDRASTVDFILRLSKQFGHDPDVLFVLVHAYSDLSTRTAHAGPRAAFLAVRNTGSCGDLLKFSLAPIDEEKIGHGVVAHP